MTSLAVLIPVKSSGAKSRLSAALSKSERTELGSLLLYQVLGALGRAGLIGVSYVVTSDRKALDMASKAGASSISEPRDEGVNSAVIRGIRQAGNPDTVLVLPSDLPLLRASEIRRLVAVKSTGLDLVIVPSWSFDGTNALLFSTARAPHLSYDDNSFWNHLGGSARKRLSAGVLSEPGVMFDVDSPDDLLTLARSRVGSPAVAFARRATR